MQKLFKNTFIGVSLLGLVACSNGGDARANPQSDDIVAPTYEGLETPPGKYAALDVPSGNYVMDKSHGYVTFSYSHKGLSHPVLRFNDVDATLVLDADKPENSSVDATIMVDNIDTGVAKLDAHLKSPDFFNTAVNPIITFKSTGFTRTDATSGTMVGDLTMMGVTKSISFDVNLLGTADGKQPTIGVEGRGKLLRSKFNLGKFVPYVGDEVSITISAEFNKTN